MKVLKEVIKLNPKFIKIPSACNKNEDIFNLLINDYKGQIHIYYRNVR